MAVCLDTPAIACCGESLAVCLQSASPSPLADAAARVGSQGGLALAAARGRHAGMSGDDDEKRHRRVRTYGYWVVSP